MASQKLFRIIIRVKKSDSSFVYFSLEASEGLAFYSTINEFKGLDYRDLEIIGTIEFHNDILNLLNSLKKICDYQILEDKIIDDFRCNSL